MVQCLAFWETASLLGGPFCILTCNAQGSRFSAFLPTLVIFHVLYVYTILVDVKRWSTAIWTCISVNILACGSWWNICSIPLSIIKLRVFCCCYWVLESFTYSWYWSPVRYMAFHVFCPSQIIFSFSFFGGTGVWTQVLTLARQVLRSPFCVCVLGIFEIGSWNYLPGAGLEPDPPDLCPALCTFVFFCLSLGHAARCGWDSNLNNKVVNNA
jgi:hypothetical protein